MSPVFRHGRLRLYLLKLLDEAPRHGYEVIRLLQDRFLGVYAPSPGTIYPRLARLEEEGLVTHDETDGRKVYRITDKGREELHARLDDLAELEEEITASVRDIAREVSEDVRETVRSLREELTSAARDIQGKGRARPGRAGWEGWPGEQGGVWEQAGQEAAGAPGGEAAAGTGEPGVGGPGEQPGQGQPGQGSRGQDDHAGGRGRSRAGQGARGWGDWQSWAGGQGWGDWSGWGGQASQRAVHDMERMARHFARELRMAAWHAQALSEDALADLRVILDETLERIRSEVFASRATPGQPRDASPGPGSQDARPGPGSQDARPGPGSATGPHPPADAGGPPSGASP